MCNKIILKGLLIILVGEGFILINVILCKKFGLYVNVCFVKLFVGI